MEKLYIIRTRESLLELYENGEISQDEYKRYKIFFDPNKVKITVNGMDRYIDDSLYKVIMKNSVQLG